MLQVRVLQPTTLVRRGIGCAWGVRGVCVGCVGYREGGRGRKGVRQEERERERGRREREREREGERGGKGVRDRERMGRLERKQSRISSIRQHLSLNLHICRRENTKHQTPDTTQARARMHEGRRASARAHTHTHTHTHTHSHSLTHLCRRILPNATRYVGFSGASAQARTCE